MAADDYIICIHVLEHIVDDIEAMSELYRVLKPGGKAFLSVPVRKDLHEDYSIVTPEAREKIFGQHDHVRVYNLDTFVERIGKFGFTYDISKSNNFPYFYDDSKLEDNIIIARK